MEETEHNGSGRNRRWAGTGRRKRQAHDTPVKTLTALGRCTEGRGARSTGKIKGIKADS